jgi:hypothetical protein
MEKEYRFTATGGFDVATNLIPKLDASGVVCSFSNCKGETVRLVIALEIEGENSQVRYITSEDEMAEEGFANLVYDQLDFTEIEDEA